MCKAINESGLLIEIESITSLWIKAKEQPANFYTDFVKLLMDFNQLYCGSYQYFGYINAWCDWLEEHDIFYLSFEEIKEKLKAENFKGYQNYFKGYISVHRKDIRRHRENEVRNTKSLSKKLDKAINRYSKLEVVRVDLAYKQKYHDITGIENFYNDLESLRKNIGSRKKLFKGLVDYAWALEQGETKGYHCHLLLIFNGHQRQKGWAIADKVGQLWKSITAKQGYYFNCHDPEQIRKYSEMGVLGIGRIHRGSSIEVRNMRNAVLYLVNPEKEDQYLRVKHHPKMRTFQ
ncbi:YagK/YfjJ domain-containing protein [Acinetobacter johnsonii]|uniref:YagK/YfjJ domain-containing protein n=1 Tax=Acinetobacter johnsonii TaxID=40214 RepID=UPI0011E698E3|nr:inovirus-type Gp2 protein [Acinetobacter johnsonii]QEK36792.1 inovirus Gp2 family protein [Acinetobacter johnsonii]